MHNELLYELEPSTIYEDCYPLGNGNLGSMDYGRLSDNIIHFNDDRLWSGNGANKSKTCTPVELNRIRTLIDKRKYSHAEKLICSDILSDFAECYLPLCKLEVNTSVPVATDNYSRSLDLTTGSQIIESTLGGQNYKHESFISHVDKVYVGRYYSDYPINVSFKLSSDMPCKHASEYLLDGHGLAINGNAPSCHTFRDSMSLPHYDDDNLGIEFYCEIFAECDGKVSTDNDTIIITDARNITLYFAQEVEYKPTTYLSKIVRTKIIKALGLGYDSLFNHHIADYSELYNRSGVFLDSDNLPLLPVSKMLQNKPLYGNRLISLLFNYGKYLTISSSREGTEASNLQGIWNKDFYPAWGSNYTLNINTQMNYWPQESINLSECCEPLFTLIDKLSVHGEITARSTFNCRGWITGHNSDIWGHSSHVGSDDKIYCQYSMYMTASAWLCRHIYEHYRFTQDDSFLRRNIKYLISASAFYVDFLKLDSKTGYYKCYPSSSPENSYRYMLGTHALASSSTIDMAIIRELFTTTLAAAKQFSMTSSLTARIQEILPKLPPYTIKHGRIAEWLPCRTETDRKHRHLSHLYGLYPGNEINIYDTPELAKAAYKSIKRRGDGGPGWSIVWKSLLYARLHLGNKAMEMLDLLLTPISQSASGNGGIYNSLLAAHPPFQIDANFGATAAICEMLVQSHYKNHIELLPALPDSLKDGIAVGLKARGGYTISMKWRDCKIYEVYIKHDFNHNAKIMTNNVHLSLATNQLHLL